MMVQERSTVTVANIELCKLFYARNLLERSKNFREIEDLCNEQYAEGYRLHTFAQSTAQSTGFGGGDRTVCNLVFEKNVIIFRYNKKSL